MSSMHHDFGNSIPNAKAIMGAAFIQYVLYAFVYVLEGSKYNELHPQQPTSGGNTAGGRRQGA